MYALKQQLLRILSVSVPFVVIFICFYPYRKRALDAQRLTSSRGRECCLILYVISVAAVLAITLWPSYCWESTEGSNALWGDLILLIDRPVWNYDVNLIPFSSLIKYGGAVTKGLRQVVWALINFCGNIGIFIPVGFFSSLLFRGATWKRSAFIGFSMSLSIEIFQWFIVRSVDIDDVILNTMGVVCGHLIYLLAQRIWPTGIQKFLCSST